MGGTVLHSLERDLQRKGIRSGCQRMSRSSLSRSGADGLSVSQAEENARAKAWRREPAWCVGGMMGSRESPWVVPEDVPEKIAWN